MTAEQRAGDPSFALIVASPHLFRHRGAQALANAGVRLDVLQTMLGHEDISTTRSRYAQHTPDEIVMEQLARAEAVAGQTQRMDEHGFAREVAQVPGTRRKAGKRHAERETAAPDTDWLSLLEA